MWTLYGGLKQQRSHIRKGKTQPHSPLGPGRICANAQADFRKAPWKAVVQPGGTTATVTVSGAASIGSGSIAVSDGEIFYPQSIDEETVGAYTVFIVHDDSGDCPVTKEEQVFKFYIEGPSLLSDKTEAKAYGLPFSYDKDMLNIYANAIHPGAPMNGGELTAFYGFKILAYPEIYSGAVEAQIRANASAPGQITIYKEEPPGGSITLGVSIDILFVQASVSETIDPDNLGAGLASTNLGLYFLDKTAEHGPYYKSHEDIAGPYPGGWKMGEWGYELNVHISTGTEPFTVGNQINLSNKIGVGSIIGEEDTVLVTCNQRCIGNVTIELETIRIPILD